MNIDPLRALISVSDKTNIVEFARKLSDKGIEILSTGGTAALLDENGIHVVDVSDHTGFNEIMGGRVKTLHPKVHGGILGRRDVDHDVMVQNDIPPIDLVVVNLYPFEKTVANPDCQLDEAIENIDIGGPAMLRAAAKNHKWVTVVVDQSDYDRVLGELEENSGGLSADLRFDLAVKAFEHTAGYDGAVATWLGRQLNKDGEGAAAFPRTWNQQYYLVDEMRYGENPHQKAAFYSEKTGSKKADLSGKISTARQLQGKAMSYNNIADTDAALECVRQFDGAAACVIVKHANPCGVAIGDSQLAAYDKAFQTDPESAFGGIIAFNHPLDLETAEAIVERQFVEVIIAPSVTTAAAEVLANKQNVRVLECGELNPEGASAIESKKVNGGLLIQSSDCELYEALNVVTRRQPDATEMKDLEFAWKVAKYVKSNAIVYASGLQTIGVGAGQMSRVNSARIAAIKAEHAGLPVAGAVMASDAFFPFRDGLDNAAGFGIRAVIQPGGSMKDDEVIAAADEHDIAMVFTGMRHFRH